MGGKFTTSMMFSHWIFLILVFGCFQSINTAPLSDSVLSNSVLLTFSNVSLDTWRGEDRSSIMTGILANLSADHCKAYPGKCAISSATSVNFKSENVKTADNYPKNKNENLEILLYVEIPTSNGSPPGKIPGDTLLTIVTDNKAKLSSEVGYVVEGMVLGEKLSSSDGKKVHNKLNRIMIPVAFLLLVVIALVAWILHRGNKKKKAREEWRRYTALQNSKNESNLRQNRGAMVNTTDVPPTQPESGPMTMPELDSFDNQAEDEVNYNVRRHKKRRALPKKPPIRKAPDVESDDVFDGDTDGREKPKRKGRRRKGRRSYDVNRDGSAGKEYEMKSSKELACSRGSSEGTNGESQVNTGYQRDSEKGESDPARMSNNDSAVELSSSVASSANHNRAKNLPPISTVSQKETI